LVDAQDIATLKAKVLASGLSISQLVNTHGHPHRPSVVVINVVVQTVHGSVYRHSAIGKRISLPN
jgi:catalase (peroxidase I)